MDLKSKEADLGWSRQEELAEWAAYRESAEWRAFMRPECMSDLTHRARVNEAATRAPFQPRDKHAHAQKVNNGGGTRVA